MVKFTTAATSSEVRAIRARLATALRAVGVPLSDDEDFTLRLLVSEVATNGVLHGAGGGNPAQRLTVEADVHHDTRRLRVSVSDPGLGRPVLGPFDTDDEHGRGMQLVAELAAAHGCEPDPQGGGKRVWFELPLQGLDHAAARQGAQTTPHRWSATETLAPLALHS
ncbi:ATP-binding protein [Kitasatospora sp. RB6PN24]|uniref:ATP-binding protein n=1 Tax=Kitasatospora humi TaxID=2893891 RepID=UPI001E47AEB9|nr:ATP-binding protein [Kitasatospora humi]MCC9310298.1 ATP-binding protein [Kitasatospora humi]